MSKRFRTWSERFGCLSFFSAGLSKQQSTYPDEQFDEKQLFKKRVMLSSFSDNERKISGRLAFSFRLSCQNCALDLRRKIWVKNEIVNFFRLFWYLNWNLWLFVEFSSGVCENWLLRVHGNNLNKKLFRTKIYFIVFAQRANISGVLLEFFRRASEKCFIGVQKNILGGKICGKSISSFTVFRSCAKTVGPSDNILRQGGV